MAKISSFIICDTIINVLTPSGDSVPQLVAPQPVLRPLHIPSSYSFGLSIGAIDVDFQETNTILVTIVSPKGEVIYNSGEINLGKIPKDDMLPREFQGFVLSMDIRNLEILDEGVYIVEMTVNGETTGKKELPIFRKGANK